MSLVLEESEDISVELLSPILDSVKKDNEVMCFELLFVPLLSFLFLFFFKLEFFSLFNCLLNLITSFSGSSAHCSEVGGESS